MLKVPIDTVHMETIYVFGSKVSVIYYNNN